MLDATRPLRLLRRRRRLRIQSTAAMLLVASASIALVGCSLLPGDAGATKSGESDTAVDAGVFTISVGDCLNDGGIEGETLSVPVIDCSKPHDSEAYASITMNDGEYPGDDAMLAAAKSGCEAEFDAFVGINYAESVLDFGYYFPTAGSWATGDREIICLIFDPAGKTTSGSLAGAAR